MIYIIKPIQFCLYGKKVLLFIFFIYYFLLQRIMLTQIFFIYYDVQNKTGCRPLQLKLQSIAVSNHSGENNYIYICIPRRYPYFDVVVGLVWSHDPNSYAGGSLCYW
jgi:hypothetical protein